MKIAVLSGKGGTGKTTISVNFAKVLSKRFKVQLLDADVEEPNAHLFFDVRFTQEEPVHTMLPVVDQNKCIHCGKCADVCQFGAIMSFPSGVAVFEKLCHGCGACSIVCPTKAISEKPQELGVVKIGAVDEHFSFGMGILNIGELSGVRIIRQLKKHTDESAQIVLIDSSPGTSCPVVESLRGADFAILVTEPTTFGLHDLKLAVELVQSMGIPAGIIVNRETQKSALIDDYSRDSKVPIILRIPFDRQIAVLYSRGKLFADLSYKWEKKFLNLYETIKGLTK